MPSPVLPAARERDESPRANRSKISGCRADGMPAPSSATASTTAPLSSRPSDVVTDAERLTNLGAKQIRPLAENDNRWIGFIDPDGNEFDLVAS